VLVVKIAMLAPPWIEVPPKNYGGIEAVVALLTEHLIALGHDVTLFCSPGSRSKATIVNPLGRSYEDQIGKSLQETDHVLQSLEYVKDAGDFDVVHDHTTIAAALAKYCKIPLVHTMHNGHAGDRGDFYCRHGSSANLVAISEAQKNTAPKSLKVSGVVPNPIDVTEWHFKSHKRPYALWMGRFDPAKGAHLAIFAARIAQIPLLLAGPIQPGQEHYFEQEIKPHLDDVNVRYVGSVGGKRKKMLYANAKVLLMPITWNEPFGMVMVESLASGTPVIAFPYGAATEIVIDGVNGYQVADAAAMADAMTDLEEIDPNECYSSVVTRYNPQAIAEGYVDMYEKAIRD
jgi:glycosyltransferase involved in cell wall biosynthesis